MTSRGAKSAKIKLCPGKDRFIKDRTELDPADFRRLVEHRARRVFRDRTSTVAQEGWEDAQGRSEDERRRKGLEKQIEKHFERVNKGRDFLPVDFLSLGASRARAVCRISTPTSLGTGFLVAPGILMTNNHVLDNVADAADSMAEFDFETGKQKIAVSIRPDRLFLTNRELDYTIVACDGDALAGIEPIALLRNPQTATRNERVNVVQHPQGRRKEIAIHDNRVQRVLALALTYQTDTEPGSSGSPVFNNDWDLVALHHAGTELPDGGAENEGIRISAIVSDLIDRSGAGGGSESLRTLMGTVTDTAPELGFFDAYGLGSALEIQVNGFAGVPAFADVGFWNIENFNRNISQRRVDDVADVLVHLNMDAMGLVEVERPALERLVASMAARGAAPDFVSIDVDGTQDIAVLFDRNTTKVKLRNDLAATYATQLAARTSANKTAFPRRPLFAEVTVGEDDAMVKFMVMVVHLKAFGDAQSQERRKLAANKLAEIIADLRDRNGGMPVVLGGDFNEQLDTDVLNDLKTSPDLFSLTADDATTDAISYVGASHRSLIDHIVVSRDVRMGEIEGDDAAIVRLDRDAGDFADTISDHVPVVFRMLLREEDIDVEDPNPSRHQTLEIPAGASKLQLTFESE